MIGNGYCRTLGRADKWHVCHYGDPHYYGRRRRSLQIMERRLDRAVWPLPQLTRCLCKTDSTIREKVSPVRQGKSPWPLVCIGEAGSGKTCAALVLADRFGAGAYATVSDLHLATWDGDFRAHQFRCDSVGSLWKRWHEANVAILDELGERKISEAAYETVKRAMDLRMNHRLPLVCIANLDVARLAEIYDERIGSRLASGTIVQFKGDRRLPAARKSIGD